MHRRQFALSAVALFALAGAPVARADRMPDTMDNLVRIRSRRLQAVYLLPGADFRIYTKVMLDPVEIAFRENWRRDYNSTTTGLDGRVTDAQVQRVVERAIVGANEEFAEAFTRGGYPVVAAGAADVLRIRIGVLNVAVTAPDARRSGRSNTYANEAGSATLVLEARESLTAGLLGRAFDSEIAGDDSVMIDRNSVSNRADFRRLATDWGRIAARGIDELKTLSPVDPAAMQQRR